MSAALDAAAKALNENLHRAWGVTTPKAAAAVIRAYLDALDVAALIESANQHLTDGDSDEKFVAEVIKAARP